MTTAQVKAWAFKAPAIQSTRRPVPRESAMERAFRELAAGRAPAEVALIERELTILGSRADGRRR